MTSKPSFDFKKMKESVLRKLKKKKRKGLSSMPGVYDELPPPRPATSGDDIDDDEYDDGGPHYLKPTNNATVNRTAVQDFVATDADSSGIPTLPAPSVPKTPRQSGQASFAGVMVKDTFRAQNLITGDSPQPQTSSPKQPRDSRHIVHENEFGDTVEYAIAKRDTSSVKPKPSDINSNQSEMPSSPKSIRERIQALNTSVGSGSENELYLKPVTVKRAPSESSMSTADPRYARHIDVTQPVESEYHTADTVRTAFAPETQAAGHKKRHAPPPPTSPKPAKAKSALTQQYSMDASSNVRAFSKQPSTDATSKAPYHNEKQQQINDQLHDQLPSLLHALKHTGQSVKVHATSSSRLQTDKVDLPTETQTHNHMDQAPKVALSPTPSPTVKKPKQNDDVPIVTGAHLRDVANKDFVVHPSLMSPGVPKRDAMSADAAVHPSLVPLDGPTRIMPSRDSAIHPSLVSTANPRLSPDTDMHQPEHTYPVMTTENHVKPEPVSNPRNISESAPNLFEMKGYSFDGKTGKMSNSVIQDRGFSGSTPNDPETHTHTNGYLRQHSKEASTQYTLDRHLEPKSIEKPAQVEPLPDYQRSTSYESPLRQRVMSTQTETNNDNDGTERNGRVLMKTRGTSVNTNEDPSLDYVVPTKAHRSTNHNRDRDDTVSHAEYVPARDESSDRILIIHLKEVATQTGEAGRSKCRDKQIRAKTYNHAVKQRSEIPNTWQVNNPIAQTYEDRSDLSTNLASDWYKKEDPPDLWDPDRMLEIFADELDRKTSLPSPTEHIELRKEFDPKKYLEQVPRQDSSGNSFPQWKRLVMAKQMAQRAQMEEDRKYQMQTGDEDIQIGNLPLWKKAIIKKHQDRAY